MKISDKTAFGQLGRRGCLGYGGRKTDLKDDERTNDDPQHPRDRTKGTELDPGDHWLEFIIDKDQNAFAHTYWRITSKGEKTA